MGQIKKNFSFRGLDTRSNKLARQDGTASDCRNVFKNSNGDLVKRPDFEALNLPRAASGSLASGEPTGDFVDKLPPDAVIEDFAKYEDHILVIVTVDIASFKYNKFYKYDEENNTVEIIPIASIVRYDSTQGWATPSSNSSSLGRFSKVNAEGILYFMGQNPLKDEPLAFDFQKNNLTWLWAYDGKTIHKAGVNNAIKPSAQAEDVGSLSALDNEYVRVLPFRIDNKNRTIFGNYLTFDTVGVGIEPATQTMTIPLADINDVDDYQCHAKFSLATDTFNALDTINLDIYSKSADRYSLMDGDVLFYVKRIDNIQAPPTVSSQTYIIYKIEVDTVNYGAGTARIAAISVYDEGTNSFIAAASVEIDQNSVLSNQLIAIYGSEEYTFGYKFRGVTAYAYDGVNDFVFDYRTNKTNPDQMDYIIDFPAIFEEFEDGYDENTVKGVPPLGRQVRDYLGALLIVDHENLYFSDISVGGTIEAFTPFDNFSVGTTQRGDITGVFSNETFIAVFREEEAYYITGNIFTANYRIQSYQSTRIGCSDPRSIVDFRGAGMFLSQRGFYICQQGGAMPEISDVIETVFTDGALDLDLDLNTAVSLVDFTREYIFFHVDSNSSDGYIFAYSYYFNEWYLWDAINADGGFGEISKVLYHSDGSDLYKESGASVGSNAYWRSNFETLGAPSFEKKFLQVLLYTIDMPSAARIIVKTFKNWITSKTATKEAKRVKVGQSDMTQRFNPERARSMAIQVESPANQALRLNGFEYEFDADVGMFKDDDQ